MQGDGVKADDNELLGEFALTGLRRAPKGEVEIEVNFEINTDGIVSVSARDQETGKEQSIQVTAQSGLTPSEVEHMVENAKDYMVERRGDEQFEAAKQEAETLLADIQRLLPQVERVVASSDFGRDAISKAQTVMERARDAIASRRTELLKAEIENLSRTQRMFKGVVSKAS
jgi:molecular chaperone DnaK